jgi:signal transduction histidine kinase
MAAIESVKAVPSSTAFLSLDRLFEAAKKATVIQLRWPLVILCSYLLLYSPGSWLTPSQTHAVLVFYLLTNATLYFVADEFFDSPYFYGPLLLFDTVFLAVVLGLSGGATPDFYVACFITLVLSCICNDSRGLIIITLLAPLIYGYVVFNSVGAHDSSIYLRLPFPLVISLFYGYFAQVERIKRVARENEEQARQHQKIAEEIRRQRERLEVLHDVNVAVTSTIDRERVLDLFLEKALIHLPYAAAIVRLRNQETGILETAAARGIAPRTINASSRSFALIDRVLEAQTPLIICNVFADSRVEDWQFFRDEALVSFLGVPLVAKGERLGSLAFLTREEHDFSEEEIDFLSTLAGQAAMALHHSRLFEQIQAQASLLEHANKVKDEFLGVVSHELKTPLNVITGYTNMIIEGILGEISPIQEKALQTVARQSKELHSLINCVLQVSSIEGEMQRAEIHEVNFWEFLYEVKSYYDYPLGKDVKLVWDFQSDLPILGSDRSKLKHILQNLVGNAIKFTDQGAVTITARYIAAKKTMEFKVADTGVGISKELLPVIFEKFRQLDSSESRSYGGVGLGLYIVKRYTDLLGGTIHVESKPGMGSTFTVRVPCQPRKRPIVHQQSPLLAEGEPSRASAV